MFADEQFRRCLRRTRPDFRRRQAKPHVSSSREPFVRRAALPYRWTMTVVHSPCDATIARNRDERVRVGHPGLVIATTILASSMALIDGSVVNVGLPAIGASFGADAVALQWVINSYLLPLSALLLLGGAAGDYFGRRRLLILGTSGFAFGSLGCALAPGLPALFASRLIQGAGAAMLMPNSLAILGQ